MSNHNKFLIMKPTQLPLTNNLLQVIIVLTWYPIITACLTGLWGSAWLSSRKTRSQKIDLLCSLTNCCQTSLFLFQLSHTLNTASAAFRLSGSSAEGSLDPLEIWETSGVWQGLHVLLLILPLNADNQQVQMPTGAETNYSLINNQSLAHRHQGTWSASYS